MIAAGLSNDWLAGCSVTIPGRWAAPIIVPPTLNPAGTGWSIVGWSSACVEKSRLNSHIVLIVPVFRAGDRVASYRNWFAVGVERAVTCHLSRIVMIESVTVNAAAICNRLGVCAEKSLLGLPSLAVVGHPFDGDTNGTSARRLFETTAALLDDAFISVVNEVEPAA